jgi:hypothetical protein
MHQIGHVEKSVTKLTILCIRPEAFEDAGFFTGETMIDYVS